MPKRRPRRNSSLLLGPVAAALLVFLLFVVSVTAHEQKTALTDMLYNERTQHLEVAHRINLHDAEHALHKATGLNSDLIRSPEAIAAFAEYAAKHFALTTQDKQVIPLTLVGQEIDEGFLWVYQETPLPKPVGRPLLVRHAILQDVVNGQVNTVNVRYRSRVATLVFEEGAGWKWFEGWE